MKRLIVIISICLAFSLSSCGSQPAAPMASIEPSKTTASKTPITTDLPANTVMYTGAIKPISEIQIAPKISGTVENVNVDVDSKVSKDDILYTLDSTDIDLQVQQAQTNYQAAQTNYDKLVNGGNIQTLTSLELSLEKAQSELRDATNNYNQQKEAYDQHIVLNQAQIALDTATTAYNNALALLNDTSSTATAQNTYDLAKTNYDNTLTLFQNGVASQHDLDTATTSYKNAEAALNNTNVGAQQAVDIAKNQMDSAQQAYNNASINESTNFTTSQTRLANATASVAAAQKTYDVTKNVLNPQGVVSAQEAVNASKTSLDMANRNLADTKITAPISGTVSVMGINKGMYVSDKSNFLSIVDLSQIKIEISVSKDDVIYMTEGKPVTISVEDTDIKDLKGTIKTVSPSADLQTGLFLVQIVVDNADGALKGGMFADVNVSKRQIN